MSAGNKRHWIIIEVLLKETNPFGEITETYEIKTRLKAEVKYNQGNIILENNEMIQTDSVTFKIYKRKIEHTNRVRFNNILYSIRSINPYYSNELEIICDKINE